MGEAFLDKNGSGGSGKINGIIEDYYVYAGENISAGSFVEFVNGIAEQTMETSVDTSLTADTSVYYVGKTAKAVALDDNRVFIAHSYGNQYHLYGVVCTIANATITMGADTAIIASEYNGEYIAKLILLGNNRVFIAHSYSSSSYLYGIVCTINGTTITHGTNTKIVSSNYASRYMAPVLLESGKIFIPYCYNTSYTLGGIVVTVSGTAISKGTAVQLGHKCHDTSTALLKDGRVFVTYNYSQNDIESRLGAKICSIDGTTITKDVEQYICATEYTGLRVDVIALENGNVFVTHGYGTDYHLYGLVCNVSGNTITAGTDTQLSADKSASYAMSLLLLQNDNVFIAYRNADEVNLCAMVVNVSNFIVSKLSDVVLNDQSHTALGISSVMLNNGTIFVAHNVGNSYYYLYAQIFGITDNIPSNNVVIPTYETQVRNVICTELKPSIDTQLSNYTNTTQIMKALELSDGNVFIVHNMGALNVNTTYLYGVVVEINGNTLVAGTDMMLSVAEYSGNALSAELLQDGRVFIASQSGGYYYIDGMVVTINGTSITIDASAQLHVGQYSGRFMNTTLLQDGRVFIAHSVGSGLALYGMVVTISGTTMTVGTDTQLTNDTDKTGQNISSPVLLPDGKVLVVHSAHSSYRYLYGVVCTISGATISKGTDTQISTTMYSGMCVSPVLLEGSKVFFVYNDKSMSEPNLYGKICTISGTSISLGTETQLDTAVGYDLSSDALSNGDVFIAYSLRTEFHLRGMVCGIDGTNIVIKTDAQLSDVKQSGYYTRTKVLSNGNVFVAHSSDNTSDYLCGQMFRVVDDVPTNEFEVALDVVPANGIAKTSGIGGSSTAHGEQVSVYQPYSAFNMIANGDFEDGVNGWSITPAGTASYTTLTQVDNGYSGKCAKFEIVQVYTSTVVGNTFAHTVPTIAGHKYYGYGYIKGQSNNVITMGGLNTGVCVSLQEAGVGYAYGNYVDGNVTDWTKSSFYHTATATTSDSQFRTYMRIGNKSDGTGDLVEVGMALYYDNMRFYDLTAMFGAGKEPTQEWCDANL